MTAPLSGLWADYDGKSPASGRGAGVLAGLGATVRPRPDPGRRVGAARPGLVLRSPADNPGCAQPEVGAVLADPGPVWEGAGAGVPPGTLERATDLALAAAALAAHLGGGEVEVDPLGVALQLHLPSVMAASYGSTWWPTPPPPIRAPGGGWYCAELGAPGDREAFERLMATLGPHPSAATVAGAAQEWRLAVNEYALLAVGEPGPATGAEPAASGVSDGRPREEPESPPTTRAPVRPRPPLDGVTVCDLTSMWAGPLATWLLARLGATVIKVEPLSRPDGTRALNGTGVHPGGRSRSPGSDSALFNALAGGKRTVSLDAGRPAELEALRTLAARADVLVDSFSPRVMPQLGLDPDSLPTGNRVSVSIPAFPPGPWRHRVGYGGGIHALSGLGYQGGGRGRRPFAAPAVAYPDPLAGLTAAATVLAALVGRAHGRWASHLEAPLWSAVQPLVPGAAGRPMPAPDPGLGRALLREAGAHGALEPVRDGAGVHLYPSGPFRAPGLPGLTAAPAWALTREDQP